MPPTGYCLPPWRRCIPGTASPYRAGLAQTALSAVAVAGFALAGRDPCTGMSTTILGLGTLGIVALQAVAALSALGIARRPGWGSPWRRPRESSALLG
ncbi:hypothetical protein AB0E25_35350 [Streptomyces bobili]|uniref:hypothetical protein n=1 Tax=Streptomyces bobili TaxID=67280 RepID=UPI0033FAF3B6